jgi:hypothetical protein
LRLSTASYIPSGPTSVLSASRSVSSTIPTPNFFARDRIKKMVAAAAPEASKAASLDN